VRNAVWILAALALGPSTEAAEVTKTARLTQDASRPFAVENLAGTMRVSPGTGPTAEVAVTLHAESSSLLDAMGLEATTDEKGRPSLRVRYPHGESHIRYPRQGGGSSDVKYDGHRVRVSTDSGVVAWAELDVRLPKDVHEAWIKNGVGALTASGVSGTIKFDTASGDITVSDVAGDILADTGSGDVKAANLRGTFKCDTGSGDCEVTGFHGDALSLDTGSGSLRAKDVDARRLNADTGSGDVKVTQAEAEEIKADTGSGNVDLEATGSRLQSVKADTGSGNIRLRLAQDASFEARADMGSGDIRSGYADAEPILKRREVVGYRRGDGRIKIAVDTGSGDVVLEPAR
jgi:lia operon protein LiaG